MNKYSVLRVAYINCGFFLSSLKISILGLYSVLKKVTKVLPVSCSYSILIVFGVKNALGLRRPIPKENRC